MKNLSKWIQPSKPLITAIIHMTIGCSAMHFAVRSFEGAAPFREVSLMADVCAAVSGMIIFFASLWRGRTQPQWSYSHLVAWFVTCTAALTAYGISLLPAKVGLISQLLVVGVICVEAGCLWLTVRALAFYVIGSDTIGSVVWMFAFCMTQLTVMIVAFSERRLVWSVVIMCVGGVLMCTIDFLFDLFQRQAKRHSLPL